MFYVLLLSLPNVGLGIWLGTYPQILLPLAFPASTVTPPAASAAPNAAATTPTVVGPEIKFLARAAGIGLLVINLLLFTGRTQPSQSRDSLFWISIYDMALAALLVAGMIFRELSLWLIPLALYWLLAGLFLMAFASRNILVRE